MTAKGRIVAKILYRWTLVALPLILVFGTAIAGFPAPAFAKTCGGPNQKACPALRRGPQCDAWLRNVRGRCVRCGGVNQVACRAIRRGPQCRGGLRKVRGRCLQLACGGLNQAGCPGFNKCNRGLVYSLRSKRCGKSKFFATLARAAGKIAETSNLCKRMLGSVPAIQVGRGPVNTVIACRRGYSIGYRCAAPKVFNLLSTNARLAGRLEEVFNSQACQRAPGPLKVLCAVGKVIDDYAVRPALCLTKVAATGGFTRIADGDSKSIELMCTAAGETAFEIAVNRAIGRRSRGRDNAARFLQKVRRIKRLGRKGARIERFFKTLEREPACRGVLN